MTDIKTEAAQAAQTVKTTATDAERAAVSTAKIFEIKQVGWMERNWLALVIGAVIGFVLGHLL